LMSNLDFVISLSTTSCKIEVGTYLFIIPGQCQSWPICIQCKQFNPTSMSWKFVTIWHRQRPWK
jgi:hypothetical protein